MLNEYDGIDPPVWGQDLSGMNGATYPTIGGPEVIEVVSGIYSNEWKPNDEGIYEIYTVGHLYQFAKKVNDDGMSFQNMEVRLKNNIGLNNTENWESWNMNNAPKNKWTPIGNPSSPFKGTFDGQGHIARTMLAFSVYFMMLARSGTSVLWRAISAGRMLAVS